ncbi:hypothetical protein X728_24590 [Mesorhizobium sp. L103C120A0]|nr:hypothetical protein X728_24590 [Mesorhizobium sp. L103C120A0]
MPVIQKHAASFAAIAMVGRAISAIDPGSLRMHFSYTIMNQYCLL